MMRRHSFALFLSVSLLANAFCLPSKATFRKRRDLSDNDDAITTTESELNQDKSDDDSLIVSSEEDDDDFKQPPSSGGGSNLFSLLNLVSAFLPSLSGNNNAQQKDAPSQPTQSPFIALKMDIFRAILQFGSSMIGLASGSSNSPS